MIFVIIFFSLLLAFSSAIWITISWVEPYLIRSGTLPIYSTCMYHYLFIFHLIDEFLLISFNHLRPKLIILWFTYLMFRNLYFNQLSGTIPDSIGNLINLQNLYVSIAWSFLNIRNTNSHIFPRSSSQFLPYRTFSQAIWVTISSMEQSLPSFEN